MMLKNIIVKNIVVCLLVFVSLGIVHTAALGEDVLKIGVDTPLTGSGASPGHYLLWGVQLAIDEVNAKGGVLGKKVVAIVKDDETNPEKAVENIKAFVYEEHVVAVLGPVNSGNADAFIPILQQEHIPVVLLVSTAEKLTLRYAQEPKNYIFRSALSDNEQLELAVEWAAANFQEIGLATDRTGYGQFIKENVLKLSRHYSFMPVKMVEFDLGDMDMRAQMEALQQAGAEAVVVGTLGPEIASLVTSADKINYHPVFLGPWTFFHHDVAQLPHRLSDGLVGVLSLTPNDSEKAQEIDRLTRERYVGEQYYPFTFVAVSYEGAMLLFEAIEQAGSTDGEAIRDALENIERFQGLKKLFINPFDKTDHELYDSEDMFLGVWKEGQVINMKK